MADTQTRRTKPRMVAVLRFVGWNALAMGLLVVLAVIAGAQERVHSSDPEGWSGLVLMIVILTVGGGIVASAVIGLIVTLVRSNPQSVVGGADREYRPGDPGWYPTGGLGTARDRASGAVLPPVDRVSAVRAGRRLVIMGGFAVTLLALTACTSATSDRSAPPSPSSNPATSAPPSVRASATSAPSALPVPAVTGGCEVASVAAIQLCNATVSIPPWGGDGCPSGKTKLIGGGAGPISGHDSIEKVVVTDVDRDSIGDVVILMSCQVGDPPIHQVFVIGRTSAGALRTLGQVVGPTKGGINEIYDIAANPDGSVRVLVSNAVGSAGPGVAGQVQQWRTYGWDGAAFVQTAGSRSFNADKTANHLSVSASTLTFAKAQGGVRTGSFTVTVKNTGSTEATDVRILSIILDVPFRVADTGACQAPEAYGIPVCQLGTIAPGATSKVAVRYTIAVADVADYRAYRPGSPGFIQLRLGDQLYMSITLAPAAFA